MLGEMIAMFCVPALADVEVITLRVRQIGGEVRWGPQRSPVVPIGFRAEGKDLN